MSSRIRRTIRRARTVSTAVFSAVIIGIGYLPKLPAVIKTIETLRDTSKAMLPWLHPLWSFILSPYFGPTAIVLALLFGFWQNWPAENSTRAQFLIEMLEDRIRLARELLAQNSISQMDWRAWEEKTVLDLDQYINGLPKYFKLFRAAGQLTTAEYESGEDGLRRAIDRQIRCLYELIDRVDSGVLRKESPPIPP